MGILAKIAWRNIWRNPRRSCVLVSALAVGVFCFVGGLAYMDGFFQQFINSAIQLQGGHIQIASPGYNENPTIRSYLRNVDTVHQELASVNGIRYAARIRTPGMVNSADQASGVLIMGVDPNREAALSSIPESVVDGTYLPADGEGNHVLIGEALASRLNVLVGERVVLMANDIDNEISAGAFKIAGLFRTSSRDFDKTHAFVHEDRARELIGYGPELASTVIVQLQPGYDLDDTAAQLRQQLESTDIEVLTWKDRSPVLVMMSEMTGLANVILVIILFTAIAFTLANSFIMVIFERIREIGTMAARGVRPGQVRTMFFLEAFFVVLLGASIGSGLVIALIMWWSRVGLDLSRFSEGLSSFGAASVVYPYVDWGHILGGSAMIFVIVLLAVLYPAIKASRFKIVDAMTHV